MSDLLSSAYKLSEESFHTQLELWEYAYDPTNERLKHFYDHEADLKKKFQTFYESALLQKDKIDPATVRGLTEIYDYYENIWEGWNLAIKNYLHDKNEKKFRHLMFELEKNFDNSKINHQIDELINIHAQRIEKTRELQTKQAHNRILVSITLLCALFSLFMIYVIYINRREKRILIKLVQTEKMTTLGQMSASMAHELNTPLMFIKGFTNRVRSKINQENFEKKPEVLEYLTDIDEGISRMEYIVNHLRNFTRESKSEKVEFSAHEVITNAFNFFNEQFKNLNIKHVENFTSPPVYIIGNKNRLEQVFVNLISNSRDALKSHGQLKEKIINVETELSNDNLIIHFHDNGPGIPKNKIEKIFDPFFTTKPVGLGTGLGLSIIQEIITEHDGSIEVESSESTGTVFIITLPCKVKPLKNSTTL